MKQRTHFLAGLAAVMVFSASLSRALESSEKSVTPTAPGAQSAEQAPVHSDLVVDRSELNASDLDPENYDLAGIDFHIVNPHAPYFLNDVVKVSWTVKNTGSAAITDSWFDDVVLSSDAVLDAARDGSLGYAHTPSLEPDATYTHTTTVLLNKAGTLYLGVHVNSNDFISERSSANNNASIIINVAAAPTEPVDVVVGNSNSLTTTKAYYVNGNEMINPTEIIPRPLNPMNILPLAQFSAENPIGYFLGFGAVAIIIGIVFTVFWIGTLIHALLNQALDSTEKIVWALAIFFFPFIGAVIYIFVAPKSKPPMLQ